jgi:hypothetical protein
VEIVPDETSISDDVHDETGWIGEVCWAVRDVRIAVGVACRKLERILADEPLQAGVVGARPTVTQTAGPVENERRAWD